jgi:hypothetical protein
VRAYSSVPPTFWMTTGKRLRGQHETLLVAFYLQTCPSANMAGLYYLPLPVLFHELGMTPEAARGALAALETEGFAEYDEEAEIVWVCDMARAQVGEALKPDDRRFKALVRIGYEVGPHPFVRRFFEKYGAPFNLSVEGPWAELASVEVKPLGRGSEGVAKGSPSLQEQEQEQEQESAASSPPTRSRKKKASKGRSTGSTARAPVEPSLGDTSGAGGSSEPAPMKSSGARPEPARRLTAREIAKKYRVDPEPAS